MYYLKTSASFDSAHFLHGYNGKCANIHGHHWVVEVKIKGDELQKDGEKSGMLIDFGDFKKAVKDFVGDLDHALIYEQETLKPETIQALKNENFRLIEVDFRPTAENFARYFYDLLSIYGTVSNLGLDIKSVTVYETPDNCAVYEVE